MLDKEQWFRYSAYFLLQIITAGEHSSRLLWGAGMEFKVPAVKVISPSCLNRKTSSTNHCTESFCLFQLNLQQTSVSQKAAEVMRCKHDDVLELKKAPVLL